MSSKIYLSRLAGNAFGWDLGRDLRRLLIQTPISFFFLLFLFCFFDLLFVPLEVLSHLASAVFTLGEAFLTIDRTVPAGFKRNFTFFLTFGAGRFEHLSRTPAKISTTATTLISHRISLLGSVKF